MTPILTLNLLRFLFIIFTCFLGSQIGEAFDTQLSGVLGGLAFGLSIVLVDRLLKGFTLRLFSSATFGLVLGLLFTRMLLASDILKYLSEDMRWVVGLVLYSTFSYIGMMLAIRSNRDEFALIIPYVRFRQSSVQDAPLLADTNIIIDGRIGEICATGFLSGSVIVPRFVVDELQRLADSSDPIKRERGQRGFDSLNQLQLNPQMSITIHETPSDEATPVDTRLVQLAKLLQARLLTNDANLCKVAMLQDVEALNLNDLAKALRPVLAAGDEIELAMVKEGRDAHQAVGYLPDGTMVVVNYAHAFLGKTVPVMIKGAIQTSGGRMYFGELRKP